jgi:hypothetical protein
MKIQCDGMQGLFFKRVINENEIFYAALRMLTTFFSNMIDTESFISYFTIYT